MADVYGVFSRCFIDCGNQPFTIFDKDGEQLKEVFINHISSVRIFKENVFFFSQLDLGRNCNSSG